jgi:ribonuclease HI
MSEAVAVFADGGCIQRNPSAIGSPWATCHVDADNERVWSARGIILAVPGDPFLNETTNNQSELFALLNGLEALPDGWSGIAYTDSLVTIRRFRDEAGLAGIPLEWRKRMALVLGRLGVLEYVLLDGHPTRAQLAAGVGKRGNPVSEHNVFCDQQCSEAGKAYMGIEPKVKRAKRGETA